MVYPHVAYPYNGILVSIKKCEVPIHTSLHEPWKAHDNRPHILLLIYERSYRTNPEKVDYWLPSADRHGEWLLMGTQLLSGGRQMFWNQILVLAAQPCEYSKMLYTLSGWIICESYLKKSWFPKNYQLVQLQEPPHPRSALFKAALTTVPSFLLAAVCFLARSPAQGSGVLTQTTYVLKHSKIKEIQCFGKCYNGAHIVAKSIQL